MKSRIASRPLSVVLAAVLGLCARLQAAPADAKLPPTQTPPATTTPAPPKTPGQGEVGDVTIKGERKQNLQIGKLDPPAAFNLEDIQNFPEERLQPVLNNPLVFEE